MGALLGLWAAAEQPLRSGLGPWRGRPAVGRRSIGDLDAAQRQRLGVLTLQPVDHLLTHPTPQIEQGGGVPRRHQDADVHVPADGIRHLQHLGPSIPQLVPLENHIELLAHLRRRDTPVQVELDRAEQLARPTSPVLERSRREMRGRHHQPAVIPDMDDHVGERDVLDAAPLTVHDDDILDAEGVRERQLDAGKHVRQRGLRGETRDHRHDPG